VTVDKVLWQKIMVVIARMACEDCEAYCGLQKSMDHDGEDASTLCHPQLAREVMLDLVDLTNEKAT